jgi:hypothetical protein
MAFGQNFALALEKLLFLLVYFDPEGAPKSPKKL